MTEEDQNHLPPRSEVHGSRNDHKINFFTRKKGKQNLTEQHAPSETEVVKVLPDAEEEMAREMTRPTEEIVPESRSLSRHEQAEMLDAAVREMSENLPSRVARGAQLQAREAKQTPPARAQSAGGGGSAASKHPQIKNPGTILMVLILGAFIAILNQTLLNVAIPHLMNDFGVSADTIQWLSTGYMLINGILIPLAAFLIAKFSTRQLFLAAMILFTVGSFICSLAPDFTVMMIGRLIQGCGAGIIMPLMMTVILIIYPPEVRGKMMGMIGIAMFFAPAVGPTLSGWLIQNWSWRLLFYVVMPIAILDIILAVIFLKNVTPQSKPKFDGWGFIFSTIGFGSLLYGISEAGANGWTSGEVMTSLAVGVVFIVLFIIRELSTPNPMLDLRVFKFDMFSMAAIVSCIVNMAMFGAAILVPIYVQNIRGYTPLQAGFLLLPGAILMGIMSPISGILFDKIGIRPLAVIGLLITAVTTWQFTKLDMNTSYSTIMWLYTFRMFGMSFIAMTIMTSGLNQLPRELSAHGTAAANTARQIASSIGTAVLVTIMSNRTDFHYGAFRDVVTSTNQYINQTVQGLQLGLTGLMGPQAGPAMTTYTLYGLTQQQSAIMGINDAFVVATALTVLALLVSFFLRKLKPHEMGGRGKAHVKPQPTVATAPGKKQAPALTEGVQS